MFKLFGNKTLARSDTGTAAQKAPRIIEAFAAEPNEDGKKTMHRKYGDDYSVFGVACTCGNAIIRILGNAIQGEDFLGDPISFECPSCGKKHGLFDSAKQGYDGELGNNGLDPEDREVREGKYVCGHCGNTDFWLTLGFEYNGEEAEIIEEEGLDLRPEDLYGWIAGNVKCAKCGKVANIIDIECA